MWDSVKNLQSVLSIIVSFISIVTTILFVYTIYTKLDMRVEHLETELHSLNIAPGIAQMSMSSADKAAQSVSNPSVQTCADLARKASDEVTQGFLLDAEWQQKMMSDLRCDRGGRP